VWPPATALNFEPGAAAALGVPQPCEIAGVEIAAAERTFEKIFGLIERRTADALANDGPARV
jgi:hypothetical protein